MKSDGNVAVMITPTATLRRSVMATPVPGEVSTEPENNGARSLLLLVGLSIMGVIISGVVATVFIYSLRTRRSR
jgi:hypothetical protein